VRKFDRCAPTERSDVPGHGAFGRNLARQPEEFRKARNQQSEFSNQH